MSSVQCSFLSAHAPVPAVAVAVPPLQSIPVLQLAQHEGRGRQQHLVLRVVQPHSVPGPTGSWNLQLARLEGLLCLSRHGGELDL